MSAERIQKQPSWVWLALGACVFALGLFVFMASSASSGAQATSETVSTRDTPPTIEFTTIPASQQTFTVTAPGRLRAQQTLDIVGEVPGKITYINPNLRVGGRVESGDLMIRIAPDDYIADVQRADAALKAAEAALAQARADRDRQLQLTAEGFASEATRDAALATFANAEAAVEQAHAQADLAQLNLDKTELYAPFPALVTSESLAIGAYVAPGQRLAQLIDTRTGEIEAGLSPQDVAAVRRSLEAAEDGSPLEAYARPNAGSLSLVTLSGYLDAFSPTVDPTSRTVTVRAVFPSAFEIENEGKVFADDFMTLELTGRSHRPLYAIPSSALRRNGWIWALSPDNSLERISVTPVDTQNSVTLVTSSHSLSGLRVMTTPLAEEVEGLVVTPVTASARAVD